MSMRRIILLAATLVIAFFFVAGSCKKRPTVPIKPIGNTTSFKYATEIYRTMSTEKGEQIKYVFDWGDGTFDTTDLYPSGDTVDVPHTWLQQATFSLKAKAIDSKGNESSGWSDPLTVVVGPNSKPNPPDAISGVDGGIINQWLQIWTKATDPDGDSVSIIFYYDTTQRSKNSGWIGPVPGGTMVSDSVKYSHAGTYYMVAYAKDTKGAISDPSPVKTMTILPMEISWQYQTPDGDAFYSSPAIATVGNDTVILIGCDDGNFYSLSAKNGAKRSSFLSYNEDAWSASPAVSSDGQRVYCADDGGWFYCFGATSAGHPISRYPPSDTPIPGMNPFYTAPAVFGLSIYEGCDDGKLYLFVDNGAGIITTPGSINTFADISSSPAISNDGSRIVFGNDSGYIYCVDASLGLIWKRYLGAPVTSSPALTTTGTIYVGCEDSRLYALSLASNGSDVFPPFAANDFVTSSPVVDEYGNVYFSTDNGTVYCVKQGNEVWHKSLPYNENVSATACLAPDTTLIINTDDGTVYGLDINPSAAEPGRVIYRIELPWPPVKHGHGRKSASLTSSPTVGPADGMFFLGSTNGGVMAVKVDKPWFATGTLPPNAPWPKFHRDIKNSGWAQ
jgi:outer membrane protein assembly factor BamB